jgi:hypothetical protein
MASPITSKHGFALAVRLVCGIGIFNGLSALPEENAGRPVAMANDIQSMSWYGSGTRRYAQNICGKNAECLFWITMLGGQ